MLRRLLGATALVVASALLASCGTSGGDNGAPAPESEGSSDASGWLAADDEAAIFLAFVTPPSTGTMQLSRLIADGSAWTVKGQNAEISVSQEDSDLTVTVASSPPWFGTIDGDRLTLNIPQDDGALAPAVFGRASVADYNGAVADLRAQAQTRNDQAAEDANNAALAESATKASEAYDSALTELGSAGQTASETGEGTLLDSYDSALSDYESAWQGMQDADAALRTGDCFDAAFLAGDVDFARGDIEFARGTLDFVDADADGASERIDTAIGEAEAAYDSAVAAAQSAGWTPPDRETLDALIPRATEAKEDLAAKRQAVHARADEIDAAADALNDQARSFADSHQC